MAFKKCENSKTSQHIGLQVRKKQSRVCGGELQDIKVMYPVQEATDHFWKKIYVRKTKVDSTDRLKHQLESRCHQQSQHMHMSPLDVLKEYCQETTLHGIRYTMREGTPLCDRLSWVIVLVVCGVFAVLFINTAWVKFRNSPTVTSVETTHLPLYKVPFPAITVCPAIKILKTRGEKLLASYLNVTHVNESLQSELQHVMSAISLLQHPFYDRMGAHLEEVPHLIPLFDYFNITNFMLEVLPTCKELFKSCFWLGREINCCKTFRLQRSENGFCYAFNSLTSETGKNCPAWEELEADGVEIFKKRTNDPNCLLRRNTGAGTTTGLEVFLKPSNKTDRLPLGQRDLNGARILIHHPSEFPEAGKGLFLPEVHGDVFTVKVSPSVTVSSQAVRDLSPSERNCIFPDEQQLDIYHTYTQSACLTECRIKFIGSVCGCVPYYFNIGHKRYSVCNLSQFWCITNHSLDLRFFRPPAGTRGFSEWSNLDCLYCLPTCHETVYNLESSQSKDNNPALNTSKGYLDVYYKDLGVVKYHRTLMFDKMQLLVSFGGIAGLFLGVSLLTVIELLYYSMKFIVAVFYQLFSWRSEAANSSQQHWYPSETSPTGTNITEQKEIKTSSQTSRETIN